MKAKWTEEYMTKKEAEAAFENALKDNTKENVKLNENEWPYVLTYFEEL